MDYYNFYTVYSPTFQKVVYGPISMWKCDKNSLTDDERPNNCFLCHSSQSILVNADILYEHFQHDFYTKCIYVKNLIYYITSCSHQFILLLIFFRAEVF